MAHDSKRGFFSSLFRNRKPNEQEEAAQLELKHRLEERIRQVLADRVPVTEALMKEENHVAPMIQKEEAETKVELLPISASVITIRKASVQGSYLVSSFEAPRSYAANER